MLFFCLLRVERTSNNVKLIFLPPHFPSFGRLHHFVLVIRVHAEL
jgi:hypothetical protein